MNTQYNILQHTNRTAEENVNSGRLTDLGGSQYDAITIIDKTITISNIFEIFLWKQYEKNALFFV